MICGLFSVFDPHSLSGVEMKFFLSSGLLIVLMGFQIFPIWLGGMFSKVTFTLWKSASLALSEYRQGFVLLFSVFIFIILMGIEGLIPYSFALSSHMIVTFSLSLPLWGSGVTIGLKKSFSSFLGHLLPLGSPSALWPFLVLVESVSLIIRPLTLAIRLMANVTAGHLILSLAGSGGDLLFFPMSCVLSSGILGFEVCISVVQAFVFFSLLSLYWGE